MLTRLRTMQHEDGFTLIELLIVVLIIGILAAIAIPVYLGVQNQAKHSAVQSDVNVTVKRIQVALTEGAQSIPNSGAKVSAYSDTAVRNDGVIITTTPTGGGQFQVQGIGADGYTYTYDSTTGKFTEGTGGSQAAATAYCTYVADKTSLNTITPPSRLFNNNTQSVYQANYYWNGNEGLVVTTAQQNSFTAFVNWYVSYESTHHTNATNAAWATATSNAVKAQFGGTIYNQVYANANGEYIVTMSDSNNSNIISLFVIPQGGSSTPTFAYNKTYGVENDLSKSSYYIYNVPAIKWENNTYTNMVYSQVGITSGPGQGTYNALAATDPAACV